MIVHLQIIVDDIPCVQGMQSLGHIHGNLTASAHNRVLPSMIYIAADSWGSDIAF